MILGVSFDDQAKNRAFSEKYDFNFPLLCDTDRKMGVAYGAAGDEGASMAKRVGVVIGSDGKIIAWDAKVNAASYPGQALKLL